MSDGGSTVGGMEPRVDLITVDVPDLAAERRFYLDGLGWRPVLDLPEVLFLQVGHGLLLSLFGAEDLARDVGDGAAAGHLGDLTLAHNVGSPQAVDAALAAAERAGGRVLKPAQRAVWGGYHAYVADPAGLRWEIAHNPGWSVDADGTVRMAEVDAP